MKTLFFLCLLVPLSVQAAPWTSKPLSALAVYPEFRAPAFVAAAEEARLAAEVAARIVAMPAREGQVVAQGAVLVRLDEAAYRIELERARAQLELVESRIRLARAQLEQSRALAARGFISADGLRIRETEVGVLESERNATRAAVAAAELALARCTIRAPYAGVVRARHVSVGDLAGPGTPLLSLAASEDAEVRARVAERQLESLRDARGWDFVVDEVRHPLRLLRVSAVLDTAGQVRDVIMNANASLPPGLGGELRWLSARPYLPAAYLQVREGELGTWVVRDGQAVFVALPRAQAGRPVALEWPLETQIVDEGRFGLGAAPAPVAEPAQ